MKPTIRSFKYGDAWLVSWSDRDFIEIPAKDGESRVETERRAVAALRDGKLMTWHSIGTAPKDGTWIVALTPESIQEPDAPKPYVFSTRWIVDKWDVWDQIDDNTQKKRTVDNSHWYPGEEPTLWMPLPNETGTTS